MNIYQNNYQKILKITPGVFELEEFLTLSAPGAKDLNVHIMHRQHSRLVIALSHYHKDRAGDLVPELDFTIAMYSTTQTAEVLMYEDCFGYALAEEADSHEIEIRDLRAQLAKHTNRQPKIKLTFPNNELFFLVEKKDLGDEHQFVEENLKKIKNKYSPPSRGEDLAFPSLLIPPALAQITKLGEMFNTMSDSQKIKYKQALDEFYTNYEHFLHESYAYYLRASAHVRLNLTLSNFEGSAPANNIEVFLRCEKTECFFGANESTESARSSARACKTQVHFRHRY
jgi:hypothetical protein